MLIENLGAEVTPGITHQYLPMARGNLTDSEISLTFSDPSSTHLEEEPVEDPFVVLAQYLNFTGALGFIDEAGFNV